MTMRSPQRLLYQQCLFRSFKSCSKSRGRSRGIVSSLPTGRRRTSPSGSLLRGSNRIYKRNADRLLFLSTTPDGFTGNDNDDTDEEIEEESSASSKTVEEQYSRKTPLEHVLLRPSMYVGPNERLPPVPVWVLADDDNDLRMEQREYGLVPALIKIFDEILVNASDNRLRHPKKCTELHVTIDRGGGGDVRGTAAVSPPCISIRNNGPGIPIQIHKEEQIYVPELLFGHLLTGSNFDDDEKRLTGGRHGYGAKLANIFSRRFTVETSDGKQTYRQTWHDNMRRADPPIISTLEDKEKKDGSYTLIEFEPDLQRLNQTDESDSIADGDYNYMCRRAVDIAGCGGNKSFSVFLNGRDVSLRNFGEYCQLYQNRVGTDTDDNDSKVVYQRVNTRWKVAVGKSSSNDSQIVSFVNGVHTARGGSHVNLVLQQVTKKIQDKLETSAPELVKFITPSLIRRHLFVGCDARIENPTFDSQMKECLTSNPSSFGSTCNLGDGFLNKIVRAESSGGLGILEELERVAQGRQQANLLKHSGSKVSRRQLLGIPKLDDAHLAGSPGEDTTIILTEGDSAKALAVSGLEIVGRERFGVFPLRGKFLNVRDASISQLTKNQEVKALVAILGLDFEKTYETAEERKELRYGRVLLMTDQDTGKLATSMRRLCSRFVFCSPDGSHIKVRWKLRQRSIFSYTLGNVGPCHELLSAFLAGSPAPG